MAGVIGNSTAYWDSWNFVLEIDGQPFAGFMSVKGIGFAFAVAQFKEGGVHGVSSQSHGAEKEPADVTLERGESGSRYFWDWRDSIKAGNVADLRNFAVAQKVGNRVVERVKLEQCALLTFEAGDFDRSAEDKKRINKVVLKPMQVTSEPV